MSLVLDSSAALAWTYSDDTTKPIRRVFPVVADHGAFVPALWRLEVANPAEAPAESHAVGNQTPSFAHYDGAEHCCRIAFANIGSVPSGSLAIPKPK